MEDRRRELAALHADVPAGRTEARPASLDGRLCRGVFGQCVLVLAMPVAQG